MPNHRVSPNFRERKLQPPFLKDVIDVFEDRIRYWLLEPAKVLLDAPHGMIAAVALATNYIEAIEIFITGQDSDRKSKKFFCRGFRRIFHVDGQTDAMQDAVASAIYESLRCGFAHDGMARSGIQFSTLRSETFLITWPKTDGAFDAAGKLESAVVNPRSYVAGIERHFNDYVRQLRRTDSTELRSNFQAAIDIKWQLGQPRRHFAMTEEEFRGGA